jgi:hypothetical protein
MFRGLINDAKAAAGSLVGKYLVRASVAVPFIVAAGFGVAALTVSLVANFGALHAYLMLAGGFTLIGLLAAFVVSVKEQEEEVAETKDEANDTASVATDAPAGPSVLAGGAKMLVRNIPLVILLAIIGLLFWSTESDAEAETSKGADLPVGKSNGAHRPAANGLHREAA